MFSLTYEINRVAVGTAAKAIREALKELGMRQCSLRTVYYQCEQRELRLDWYGLFWRWFRALWIARREGAELLFEDFCSRVSALREEPEASDADYGSQLARCESEHSELISAALRGEDPNRIRKHVLESIAAHRRLLAVLSRLDRKREAA